MSYAKKTNGYRGITVDGARYRCLSRTFGGIERVMAIRIISFICGALFGAGGAVFIFHFVEHAPVHWGMVGLAAGVMGLLAALFGRKFWDAANSLWP